MEAFKIIKGLVILLLLIGLSINALTEIQKFLGKKTMVSIYNEPQQAVSSSMWLRKDEKIGSPGDLFT